MCAGNGLPGKLGEIQGLQIEPRARNPEGGPGDSRGHEGQWHCHGNLDANKNVLSMTAGHAAAAATDRRSVASAAKARNVRREMR